ncbi:MAG TPA: response regulator [Gammaproteobacteria bacterium]|nr:response regulator [Gammaproteobacteria bacterium]
MRILIIEDEKKTASFLHKGLTESGFVVERSGNGEDGLFLASTEQFDVIILDIMLPRLDGWSVLEALRYRHIETPVLFLTACDLVDDRVKGLELGADDYLVKPFAFAELLARVRTLLRRNPERQLSIAHIEDLKIDPVRHRAERGGKRLNLRPKEFALLLLFVRRAGEVLTRTLIAEQVWDMNFDSDTNVVDVTVRRLRSKVDDPFEKKLIRTIRGVGYVMEEG